MTAPTPEERAADTFREEPDPRIWRWDRCPAEDVPTVPGDDDPCDGCAGWGMECGAIWVRT